MSVSEGRSVTQQPVPEVQVPAAIPHATCDMCTICCVLAVAAFLTTGNGVIADIFPPEQRGTASGLFMISLLIGPLLGPLLGGAHLRVQQLSCQCGKCGTDSAGSHQSPLLAWHATSGLSCCCWLPTMY